MTIEIDVLCYGFPAGTEVAGLGYSAMALVRSKNETILVDTGGAGARKFLWNELIRRSISPQDISKVFLTHIHWDHCCNIDLFPHAEFVLSRTEWEYGMTVDPNEAPFVYGGYLSWLRAFRKRMIVEEGEVIIPGVTALFTPGHTPGSMSLIVETSAGKYCIAGDAIKNLGELVTASVKTNPDPEASAASIRKIRRLCSRILPGHDGLLRWEGGKGYRENGGELRINLRGGSSMDGDSYVLIRLDSQED